MRAKSARRRGKKDDRTPAKKRVASLVNRVRQKPAIREIELIYLETGWLTPTIALMAASKLAEQVKKHPVRLPKMRRGERLKMKKK